MMTVRSKLTEQGLPVLLLALATLVVFGRVLGHDFLTSWDDGAYLVANQAAHGLTPEHLYRAFTGTYLGNYAPLHIISYMIDYQLWGLAPRGFLLTNLVLHAANGYLLYLLLLHFTDDRAASLAGALLFVVHPVQVESVAWISQRKNLLALFFMLAALLSYCRSRAPGTVRDRRCFYAIALFLSCCALLAKSVAVVLPLVLLCYDHFWQPAGGRRCAIMRSLPFWAAAAVAAILALWSQTPEQGGGRVPWWGGSPYATFCTMLTVLVRYFALLIWPHPLSAVYDQPVKTGFDLAVAGAAVLLATMAGAGWWLSRRDRRFGFGLCVVALGLLPVSQIVPITTLMNDRYLYVPMVGVSLLAATYLTRLGQRRSLALSLAAAVIALLGITACTRTAVWRTNLSLWSDTAAKAPGVADVWYNLGRVWQGTGRLDEATAAYLRALSIEPFHLKAFDNLAVIFPATALPAADRPAVIADLVRNYPPYPWGMALLGHQATPWRYGEIHRQLLVKVLGFAPTSTTALLGLANISLRAGAADEAARLILRAGEAGADRGLVLYNLACTRAAAGDAAGALRQLRDALAVTKELARVARRDPYLAALKDNPEFRRLTGVSP